MPETPEEFWERARAGLRAPPVEEWQTWPFTGPVVPRALEPPLAAEQPRHGIGGIDCTSCMFDVATALWHDDNWFVRSFSKPTGLPCVLILHTRDHLDFHELDDELARELGPLLVKIQRAVFAIGDIGNVHVCRWGDGSEHFHVWFMARPARIPQLIGSFAAIWDDIVPPLPEQIWRANLELVREALHASL